MVFFKLISLKCIHTSQMCVRNDKSKETGLKFDITKQV